MINYPKKPNPSLLVLIGIPTGILFSIFSFLQIGFNFEDFKNILETKGGFISAHWDGTDETENKIKNYLINQSKLKKEKHSYSIEEFGLNEAKVKDCFKNYMMNYEFWW